MAVGLASSKGGDASDRGERRTHPDAHVRDVYSCASHIPEKTVDRPQPRLRSTALRRNELLLQADQLLKRVSRVNRRCIQHLRFSYYIHNTISFIIIQRGGNS